VITPKLSELESKLFTLLSTNFPNYGILPEFDTENFDLTGNKVVIILKHIGDDIEGKVITRKILHPLYTLIVLTQSYLQCRKVLEEITEYFDYFSEYDLGGEDWGVTQVYKERTLSPVFDSNNRYYMGVLDYRIHLTSYII
jgi:hypothetical protein